MTSDNINASGLLGVVLATCLLLWWNGEHRTTTSRVVLGIVIGLFVGFFSAVLTAHACEKGQPVFQWAIPCVCILLLFAFLKFRVLCWLAISGLGMAALGLSAHFSHLVHEGGLTGNPRYEHAIRTARARSQMRFVQKAFTDITDEHDASYPAAWVADSPIQKALSSEQRVDLQRMTEYHTVQTYHHWHTWFTGIYGKKGAKTFGVWYPGGPLNEGITGLAWRQKPSPSDNVHPAGAY